MFHLDLYKNYILLPRCPKQSHAVSGMLGLGQGLWQVYCRQLVK